MNLKYKFLKKIKYNEHCYNNLKLYIWYRKTTMQANRSEAIMSYEALVLKQKEHDINPWSK